MQRTMHTGLAVQAALAGGSPIHCSFILGIGVASYIRWLAMFLLHVQVHYKSSCSPIRFDTP